MSIYPSVINSGSPVKSSIPLVEKSFGQGLGFKLPSAFRTDDDKDVIVELSLQSRSSKLKTGDSTNISSSPLLQALDTLGEIAKKIEQLQGQYKTSAAGAASTESITSEIEALSKEFKRITATDIFKTSTSSGSGSVGFTDSSIKNIMSSADPARIAAFREGIDGLTTVSFDDVLNNQSITGSIKDFIRSIKSAIKPNDSQKANANSENSGTDLVTITAPQIAVRTIGQAEGLSVSLLSYSNEDIIKAAASGSNLDATNVLFLTFNTPEPETEEERKKREEEADLIEVENPE